jgi:hypothetical protein
MKKEVSLPHPVEFRTTDKFHKPNDSDYQVYFKSVNVLHKNKTD